MSPSRSSVLVVLASIVVSAPFASAEEPRADRVATPAGYADRACVRVVASGTTVTDDPVPGCTSAPSVADDTPQPASFVAWSNTEDSHGFQSIHAKFVVPPAPSHHGHQLLYIFPSLTGSSNPPILQPVLQWGFNTTFGGEYWLLAAWYVGKNGVYAVTTPVVVSPGDVLDGAVVNDCSSGVCSGWTVTGSDESDPSASVTLSVSQSTTSAVYRSAQGGVLEDYQVDRCDELPGGPILFSDIVLVDEQGETRHPRWKLDTNPSKHPCDYVVTNPGPGEITIGFSSAAPDAGAGE